MNIYLWIYWTELFNILATGHCYRS